MPKSIYFTDDRYEQIVEAARKCGYRVSRGRGSQLAQFVVWASNTACSGRGGTDGESFHAVIEMVNPNNPHWRKPPRR